jgi:hypothetical protein
MSVTWITLILIIGYIIITYVKNFGTKTRVVPIFVVLFLSFIFILPIFPFLLFKLLGLFLLEKLWIVLAVIFILEGILQKKYRFLMIILGIVTLIIYFYIRRII